MKTRLMRYTVAIITVVSALGLGAGVASASTATITNTGPNSTNWVQFVNSLNWFKTNTNAVGVNNINGQTAHTGNAHVHHNTTAGSAVTGGASNSNNSTTVATVVNTPSGLVNPQVPNDVATIVLTGPNSTNWVQFVNTANVAATNTNVVNVNNINGQDASSGNANVNNNTTGGSAVTGSANNSNSSGTTVTISN